MIPRLSRYALLTGGATLVVWFLTRQLVASAYPDISGPDPLNFKPLAHGLGVDLAGLAVGVLLGVGITWLYARYLDGL